ncbi:TRP-domain-containing protein [Saccharata proteae CBS 121410]|uniref:TRP-domain-containing protein n=1 Tax=Saccharata proteae CBS 121410 TaxID=1314787 RepID=A0A9P4HYZ3_9PEZI|nr:TRP-domain-containing protein [Saccharata proteae CBS 121410]
MLSSVLLLAAALPAAVYAGDVLKTDGFTTCMDNATIQITKMDVTYDRTTNVVVFDIAGSSTKEQKVMASLEVTAYGRSVYSKTFNPCDSANYVEKLCPVPAESFTASGTQTIPDEYKDDIPSIAFQIPDLDGQAKMQLTPIDGGDDLACIQSDVTNGKSMNVAAVSYVAAGIAGAALLMTGATALGAGAGATVGAASPSPSFGEVMGWFQAMSMNGMMSVKYPKLYTSFSKNFAFSGGLIPWSDMQNAIDSFRKVTGGNLTDANYEYLQNATLVNDDGTSYSKRAIDTVQLWARDSTVSSSNSTASNSTSSSSEVLEFVHGIKAYVEELTIPQANTFMTVLLIFAIVIASITVGILLFKVILETWALFGSFPNKLTNFRKRYWWILAKTITNLILLLYSVWVLYCLYQFTNGDSWAAKVLAGVTLAIFTGVLAFFTWKIWYKARQYQKMEGDASVLFEDKETWRKYSMFYENYKKGCWWLFVPAIVYSFAKGCVIAGGEGHGFGQTVAQLFIECAMLILLGWQRPYTIKSSNVINITIQCVRVLSVACVLIFVEELGISQTTQTITGLVLIVMQSVLTGVLAVLIAVNSIIVCCRENPHRKKRKEAGKWRTPSPPTQNIKNIPTSNRVFPPPAEKLNRDLDNLTPLDARNSLLMDPTDYKGARHSVISTSHFGKGYDPVPMQEGVALSNYRDLSHGRKLSKENLLDDAASMGHSIRERSVSPAPRLPDVEHGDFGHEYGHGYKGVAL